MLKRERQAFILHQLDLHNKVLNTELSALMQVSEDTIRRDLIELSKARKLIKVHGGALSLLFRDIKPDIKNIYSGSLKTEIARKAQTLIQDGMFIVTGGGTTVLELARTLPASLNATFISGSIPALNIYSDYENIKTIAIGGLVDHDAKIAIGAGAISALKGFNVDICFLGTNAISIENGISDIDIEVVELKKAMLSSAKIKAINDYF